jgi:hypothetical protein
MGIIDARRSQNRGAKVTKYVSIAVLLVMSSAAIAAKVQNLIDVQVPANIDGSSPSLEDVKTAILAGCKRKRWIPVVDEDGNITCSITVRSQHYAEVEIPYSEKDFSILYKTSRGLKYNEASQKIHRNYNKWVTLLSQAIQQQF